MQPDEHVTALVRHGPDLRRRIPPGIPGRVSPRPEGQEVILVEDHLPDPGRRIHSRQQVELRYDEEVVFGQLELVTTEDGRGGVEPRQPVARCTEPQGRVDSRRTQELDVAGLDPDPATGGIRLLHRVDHPTARGRPQIFSTGA
jgi:hypothetical protein